MTGKIIQPQMNADGLFEILYMRNLRLNKTLKEILEKIRA